MKKSYLFPLSCLVFIASQVNIHGDNPKKKVPLVSQFGDPLTKVPTSRIIDSLSKQDLAKRKSLKTYAYGMLCLREDRLLEALKAFEDALNLDPQAVPVHKSLIPLYMALGREKDALNSCRKVLAADPADPIIWHKFARLMQNQGENKEALDALEKGLAKLDVTENLNLAQQIYHDMGQLQESEKQYSKAAKSYTYCAQTLEQALKTLPLAGPARQELVTQTAGVYEKVGRLFVRIKRYEAAFQAYHRAQRIYPAGSQRWNLNLAEISRAQGRKRDALKYVDEYLRFLPHGTEAYQLKISLLEELNRSSEILPWLRAASQRDRHNADLKILLAKEFGKRGDPEEAESIYLDLVQQNPKVEIYQHLFHLYDQQPRFGAMRVLRLLNQTIAKATDDKALIPDLTAKKQAAAMVSAIRRNEKLAKNLVKIGLSRADDSSMKFRTLHLLAALADHHKQPEEAERFYRQCLRFVTPDTEALIYGGLLRVLWKAHKYREMVEICNQGLDQAQATNRILFYSDLARAYSRLNQMEKALEQADEAIKMAGDTSRLPMQSLKLRLMVAAGKDKAAEKECDKLIEEYKQPGEIREIRYILSYIYTARRDFPKAEEQLQLILEGDPTNATAYNDLGYLWADQGKYLEKAEQYIRKAIELDREERQTLTSSVSDIEKDNAAYVDSLGWVLFRQGKIEAAKKHLIRATKLGGGDDPVIWDHLGDVYFRLKDSERAHQCWRKAQVLFEEQNLRIRDQQYRDLVEKIKLLEAGAE